MLRSPSSFRDPSGYVFEHDNKVYRGVNKIYTDQYRLLVDSGLLKRLFDEELLVHHEIADFSFSDFHLVLKPDKIPTITYPYEWSFTQLKEAALHTLKILKLSLKYGMILKDASAFNIQFKGLKPILIDTLSFEIYTIDQLWKGYRQFCEHFLAPLCLASYVNVECLSLWRLGIEGIPLKMASRFLPYHTWLTPGILFHIHLHAGSIEQHSRKSSARVSKKNKVKKKSLIALISHLQHFIEGLKLAKAKTTWEDYDKETHYSPESKDSKSEIIVKFVNKVEPTTVCDIGANDGFFSRQIAKSNRVVLSLDSDQMAIEKNFIQLRRDDIETVLPLYFDLANPSPNLGWANQERSKLEERSKPDLLMALALIHHLVITHNIPFEQVAQYFSSLSKWLIIEFVPKDDEKINPLPESAGKMFYERKNFEHAFFQYYDLIEERKINNSERSLFLLSRKQ